MRMPPKGDEMSAPVSRAGEEAPPVGMRCGVPDIYVAQEMGWMGGPSAAQKKCAPDAVAL